MDQRLKSVSSSENTASDLPPASVYSVHSVVQFSRDGPLGVRSGPPRHLRVDFILCSLCISAAKMNVPSAIALTDPPFRFSMNSYIKKISASG